MSKSNVRWSYPYWRRNSNNIVGRSFFIQIARWRNGLFLNDFATSSGQRVWTYWQTSPGLSSASWQIWADAEGDQERTTSIVVHQVTIETLSDLLSRSEMVFPKDLQSCLIPPIQVTSSKYRVDLASLRSCITHIWPAEIPKADQFVPGC